MNLLTRRVSGSPVPCPSAVSKFFLTQIVYYTNKAHIQNIHALNSDTHTLFLSKLILNSQCVSVAIEGIDIWYKGIRVD